MRQSYILPSTVLILGITLTLYYVTHSTNQTSTFTTLESVPSGEESFPHDEHLGIDSLDLDEPKEKHKGRRRLMIFTTMRSGSSFVGELFQQNPDFFYMFEPLKIVSLDWPGYTALQKEGSAVVNRLLHCEFELLFHSAYQKFGAEKSNFIKRWTKRAFCGKLNENQCRGITASHLGNLCNENKHVALKTILLNHVQSILPLLQTGVHVIHLMRDPRGMINSMKRIHFEPLQKRPESYISSLCRRLHLQLNYTEKHMIFKIRRYILLRYEDIALSPINQTHKLYKFLDLKVPKTVTNWIETSTKVNKTSGKAFSTKRNSSRAAQSWRNTLSWNEVNDIQSRPDCRAVLEALGYTIFRNSKEYLDKTIPTLGLLPNHLKKSII